MKADSGLNRLVYEYFEARILYGYYKYGESLPSIKKICQMFHLAQATVRAALTSLENRGYIRVEPRKTPKQDQPDSGRMQPGILCRGKWESWIWPSQESCCLSRCGGKV